MCVYELGHGIYPSAYLSVGACARYGAALGYEECGYEDPGEGRGEWVEAEERNRTCWAILILDR